MSHTHTPEPWVIGKCCNTAIFSGNRSVASTGGYQSNAPGSNAHDENISNARRIMACVNACAGIPIEDLTGGIDKGINWVLTASHVAKQRDELQQQRDTLLAAMKKLACLGNCGAYGNSTGNLIAQAAIAAIEGGEG